MRVTFWTVTLTAAHLSCTRRHRELATMIGQASSDVSQMVLTVLLRHERVLVVDNHANHAQAQTRYEL